MLSILGNEYANYLALTITCCVHAQKYFLNRYSYYVAIKNFPDILSY